MPASSVMVAESGYGSIRSLAAAYQDGAEVPGVTAGATWLGKGLAMIAHVLAPEAILIGGSAGLLGGRYLEAVRATFRRHTLVSHHATAFHFARLGADSGLIGAGLMAVATLGVSPGHKL